MWHAGEGRLHEAWLDIAAILRLTQLFSQTHCLVEQVIATDVAMIALNAATSLVQMKELRSDFARQIHNKFTSTKFDFKVRECFEFSDRLSFLDAICHQAKPSSSSDHLEQDLVDDITLSAASIDWNVVLRDGNVWYDRICAAVNLPTFQQRRAALDSIESDLKLLENERDRHHSLSLLLDQHVRSKVIGSIYICHLLPAPNLALSRIEAAHTKLELTRLAAALAVYRADQGEYPADLSALVPAVLPQLPTDLYTGKPFVYHRTQDGYILYSLGENGIDDGGSHQLHSILAGQTATELNLTDEELAKRIPGNADDHALRVPRPKFQLPKPASPAP
jgi:hypothetical protein